jgi:hypothetical protein
MPGVVGAKTPMSCFLNWYVAQLHIGARVDTHMAMAFQNVTNLLAPPQSLLKPRIAGRILAGLCLAGQQETKATRLEAAAKGAF